MQNLNNPEPMPVRKEGEVAVWPKVWNDMVGVHSPYHTEEAVILDMAGRDKVGWERYGGPLVTNDGRNTLVDLYQEVLDASVYAKKTLMEGRLTQVDEWVVAATYRCMLATASALRWIIQKQEDRKEAE